MRSTIGLALGLGLWFGTAAADTLEGALSFGHKDSLSQNTNGVPGWKVEGEPQPPGILSDRIVLTPPWPGNRRGALWADQRLQNSEWTANFEFRATGPERGGGNLQVWYTKDTHGTSSIYTVGQFDGLVLVVDTYGGRGGTIRGFLNDGSTDYKGHHNVDSLAFGHCDYPYRNLGRLTKLQVKQTKDVFEVTVDDKSCFKTNKVKLPANHHFGISAASAETPDSFEVYKFIVHSSGSSTSPTSQPAPAQTSTSSKPSSESSTQLSKEAQSNLETQVQSLASQIEHLRSQLVDFDSKSSTKQPSAELKSNNNPSMTTDQFNTLNNRISKIETLLQQVQKDIQGVDYKTQLTQIQESLKESHESLRTSLARSMHHVVSAATPKTSGWLLFMILFQVGCALAYVAYKMKRRAGEKKYV
ncbi:MAG: hypothetical protein M1816_001315 [Peltula sp. TS41687]|nr:MAG: hypothetical protein M1816_001315 [Peltula sp. TS41687]